MQSPVIPPCPQELTRPEDVPVAARDHHRWLSEVDWAFRRASFDRPELRRPSHFDDIYPYALGSQYGFDNHPWPLFLDRARWQAVERDTTHLTRLLLDIPRRVLGHDTRRLASFYGQHEPHIYELLFAEPNGIGTAVSRGDYLFADGELRCLELNVSANTGGWDAGELAERYAANPYVAAFLDDAGQEIVALDPLEIFFRHVIDTTRAQIGDGSVEISGRLDLAMAYGSVPTFPPNIPFRHRAQEIFRRLGRRVDLETELHVLPVAELSARRGRVFAGDRRIHALIEDDSRASPAIYRAFKAGNLALFNGPLELTLSDKRNLALLSEHAETDLYDETERELVRRLLPWTRLLRPGSTSRDGDSVDLVSLLLRDPGSWVLKPGTGRSGAGVIFGDSMAEDAWRGAVEEGVAAGDWIVQEQIKPAPFVSLDVGSRLRDGVSRDGKIRLHDAVYGFFVCGDRMAGGIMRYQVSSVGGAVNAARSATPGAPALIQPV